MMESVAIADFLIKNSDKLDEIAKNEELASTKKSKVDSYFN